MKYNLLSFHSCIFLTSYLISTNTFIKTLYHSSLWKCWTIMVFPQPSYLRYQSFTLRTITLILLTIQFITIPNPYWYCKGTTFTSLLQVLFSPDVMDTPMTLAVFNSILVTPFLPVSWNTTLEVSYSPHLTNYLTTGVVSSSHSSCYTTVLDVWTHRKLSSPWTSPSIGTSHCTSYSLIEGSSGVSHHDPPHLLFRL